MYSLNIQGKLLELNEPQVMGILNVTPDSFYAPSRKQDEEAIRQRAAAIIEEGGTMIDVGAYSSRPGADEVSEQEEMERLRLGLAAIRRETPTAVLSVDTFRADVAKMCVEEFGVQLINDISGGQMDERMFATVARLGVPYILMHMQGTPKTMQREPKYDDVVSEVFAYFSERLYALHELGVNDVILDPGFGFGKTVEHNYELMAHLEELHEFDCPLLVGVSRKSMIFRLLDCTPSEALNGTTALHAIALLKGAHILRVHDVKAAVETVKIVGAMRKAEGLH